MDLDLLTLSLEGPDYYLWMDITKQSMTGPPPWKRYRFRFAKIFSISFKNISGASEFLLGWFEEDEFIRDVSRIRQRSESLVS